MLVREIHGSNTQCCPVVRVTTVDLLRLGNVSMQITKSGGMLCVCATIIVEREVPR